MSGRRLLARDRRSRTYASLLAAAWLWLVCAAALPAILRYLNVR